MDIERPLPIAEVERRTGLGKDTLRVWERRYGFPSPTRAGGASRAYPADQVEKLRLIRALLDRGHRPAGLVHRPTAELRDLLGPPPAGPQVARPVEAFFDDLRRGDAAPLNRWLTEGVLRHGLATFVLDIAAPSAAAVGESWAAGRLPIYAEHLFTEHFGRVLRMAISDLPAPTPPARPRVLLATLPGEPHMLGLLMAEAILALEGAACASLGAETPPSQIAAAARARSADVVALSVSAASAPKSVRRDAAELMAAAPPGLEIWIGGAGAGIAVGEPVRHIGSLESAPGAVQAWRAAHRGLDRSG